MGHSTTNGSADHQRYTPHKVNCYMGVYCQTCWSQS